MKLQNKIVLMPILATLFIGLIIYFFYRHLENISSNLVDKQIPQTIYAYEMMVNLQESFNNVLEDIDSKNYLNKKLDSNDSIEEFKKYLNSFRVSNDNMKLEIVDILDNDIETFIGLSERLYFIHDDILSKVIERSKIINEKLENIIDDKFQVDLDKNDINYDDKLTVTYEVEINLFEYLAAARGYLVNEDKILKKEWKIVKVIFSIGLISFSFYH